MQNRVCRSSLQLAAVILMSSNFAAAQVLSPAPLGTSSSYVSSVPMASTYATPAFKWDYRFDAQYNSTIKPYLRWYNRQGNKAPVNGVRYPYYMGPQPYYGGGMGGGMGMMGGCDTCGQTGYSSGYVQPRRSSWFNPYQQMNHAPAAIGQPTAIQGDHHGVLPYLSQRSPKDGANKAAKPAVETKTAWVKLETVTNSASILYAEPAVSVRDEFVQANVTTENGKVAGIEWLDQPSEQLTTVFAKYIK